MRVGRTLFHSQRGGSTAIEFAMLFPVFFTLTVGLIDCSWIIFERIAMEAAIQEGCRAGAILDPGQDQADINDALTTAEDRIELAMMRYGLTCTDCTVNAGALVVDDVLNIQCSYTNDATGPVGFIPTLTLNAGALMRFEVQR